MREAEAALSLKEIRQRLAELEQHWAVSYFSSTNDRNKHELTVKAVDKFNRL